MESESRVYTLIKQNLLPIILGLVGFVLVLFGLFQFFINKSEPPPIVFEEKEDSKEKIVVDVEGAVISPGVYSLTSESRIVDALAAAGGLSLDADRVWVEKNINLAKKATDGVKIYIPRTGEQVLSETSSSIGTAGPVVNINTASSTDLDSLPGVGAVTSQKIIDGRPYGQIEELLSKKIVGQATFDKIKDKISAD